jgi:ketosteroid isomerase-like protein
MKTLFALVTASALLAASAAFAGDAAVEAPIRQMTDGFNKGDIAAVKALHVPAPTIVDNVPPFIWTGPKAFDTWLGDLVKSETALGKTDGAVWFGEPVDEVVAGDRAYVVTPCAYTYKLKGQTVREAGMTAFVLVKTGGAWKIESWSWASPKGVAVQ